MMLNLSAYLLSVLSHLRELPQWLLMLPLMLLLVLEYLPSSHPVPLSFFYGLSGLLAAFETTVIERTIITSATATHASFFTFFFSIISHFLYVQSYTQYYPINLTYFIIFFITVFPFSV